MKRGTTSTRQSFRASATLHEAPRGRSSGGGSLLLLVVAVLAALLLLVLLPAVEAGLGPTFITLLLLGTVPAAIAWSHDASVRGGASVAHGTLTADGAVVRWIPQYGQPAAWGADKGSSFVVIPLAGHPMVIVTAEEAEYSSVFQLSGSGAEEALLQIQRGPRRASIPVRQSLEVRNNSFITMCMPAAVMAVATLVLAFDRLSKESSSSYGGILWFLVVVPLYLLVFVAAGAAMFGWCRRGLDRLVIDERGIRFISRDGEMLECTSVAHGKAGLVLTGTTPHGEDLVRCELALYSLGPPQRDFVFACISTMRGDGSSPRVSDTSTDVDSPPRAEGSEAG